MTFPQVTAFSYIGGFGFKVYDTEVAALVYNAPGFFLHNEAWFWVPCKPSACLKAIIMDIYLY